MMKFPSRDRTDTTRSSMWEPPANVAETTALIVDANIGLRAFNQSLWPVALRGKGLTTMDVFAECSFWVQVDHDPIARTHIKQVVMHHHAVPDVEVITAERGIRFGKTPWPLQPEQQQVVDRLASEWLRNNAPTSNTHRHARSSV